jgi:hypothetical protein
MKDLFIGLLIVLLVINIIFIICCLKASKDKEE